MRTKPLSLEQHRQIAEQLNQAAKLIMASTHTVDRAQWTDRCLTVAGYLQEWLIDPLRDAWSEHPDNDRKTREMYEGPYQSVGYSATKYRRKKPHQDRNLSL